MIRLITVVLAVLYSLAHLDYEALAMRLNPGLSIIAERGSSWIITAGTIGVYATCVLCIVLVFFAIPRRRFGALGLSWSFALMSISLLAQIVQCRSVINLGWYVQVPCYTSTLCFALPPLVMFAFLQHPVVQRALQPQL